MREVLMAKRNTSNKKIVIDDVTRKTDDWIVALKKGDIIAKQFSELDTLPTENFIKVVDHQEFEVLKAIVMDIKKHRKELFDCMFRKYNELCAEDRHDVIDFAHTKMRRDDVSSEEKKVWKQFMDRLIPVKMKRAA
jgi:hypothetical protein